MEIKSYIEECFESSDLSFVIYFKHNDNNCLILVGPEFNSYISDKSDRYLYLFRIMNNVIGTMPLKFLYLWHAGLYKMPDYVKFDCIYSDYGVA